MAKNNQQRNNKSIQAFSRPYTAEDEKLEEIFGEIESKNLETTETAARLLTTLSTTLMTIFFGVFALKEMPAYLNTLDVKILLSISMISFFSTVAFSLASLIPRNYEYSARDLNSMQNTLTRILEVKKKGVRSATVAFILGMVFMLGSIIDILYFHL